MKNLLLTVLFAFTLTAAFAQEEEEAPTEKKGFQKEKLFFGGNFGLSFGDYTLINISPQVGYRFNQTIAAGVGINAQYIGFKNYLNGQEYSKTSQGVMGLNIFGRVYPLEQFMLQVQPEANYIFGKVKYYTGSPSEIKIDAKIVPSLLLGGGLVLPTGGRGAFIASVFYDVLQDPNSPYGARPIYNFGYNIGF